MFPLILIMATVISLTAIIGGLMLEHSKLKHKNKNDGELDRLWDEKPGFIPSFTSCSVKKEINVFDVPFR